MEWSNGPILNVNRTKLVAAVCCDKVYAIGRYDKFWIQWRASKCLHCWKWKHPSQEKTTANGQDCNVTCCLYEGGDVLCCSHCEFCAQLVCCQSLGGYSGIECLSSVDIMDIAPLQQWRTHNSGRTHHEFLYNTILEPLGWTTTSLWLWMSQQLAIHLSGISLVLAAGAGHDQYKLYVSQFLMESGTTPDFPLEQQASCHGQGGIVSHCLKEISMEVGHMTWWKCCICPTGHCLESFQFDHSWAVWLLHGHFCFQLPSCIGRKMIGFDSVENHSH